MIKKEIHEWISFSINKAMRHNIRWQGCFEQGYFGSSFVYDRGRQIQRHYISKKNRDEKYDE